jgi:hypothetical protein
MYDQSITDENLAKTDPKVILAAGTPQEQIIPFELQEFSISTVHQAIDHINNKIDLRAYRETCDKNKTKVDIHLKNPSNPFTLDELIFMENERIMCKWNYNYWAERYYRILNTENLEVQYRPNTIQQINNILYARMNKARRAINKWSVKSRQVGDSTDSEGRILHRINYFEDAKSLIASKDKDSTDKMSQMFLFALDRLPFWNRTFRERYQTGEYFEFDINSLLDLGSGATTSVGRGRTPTICHISEAPFFKNPQKSLTEALFPAMHESIWQLKIVEGTAEVRGDWFHKEWLDIISGMEKGITSWTGVFFPWFLRRDIYPTDAYVRARSDAYERWVAKKETLALARKAEIWVRTHKDVSSILGLGWKMDREQMFWYETQRDEAERKGQLARFLKEYPSDSEEAFQHAGHTMYPVKLILDMSDQAQSVEPEVYKLKGDPNEINPTLWPTIEETVPDGRRINIHARWGEQTASDYQLVQVYFNGWDNFDPVGKILIWEHPRLNSVYGMGIDPSDGLGRETSDNAVLEIIKKGTIEYKDKQVCEFASPELPQSLLWPYAHALGTYYSPQEQLLIAPEINKGTELLTALVAKGWQNIVKIYDSNVIGQDLSSVRKYGFETNNRTRPDLINKFNAFIIGEWIELYSMKLIEELKDLTKSRTISQLGSTMREKILGDKDDRFMAMGIILYSIHRDEFVGLQAKSWEERARNNSNVIVLGEYKPDNFQLDDGLNYGYNEEEASDYDSFDDNLVISTNGDYY